MKGFFGWLLEPITHHYLDFSGRTSRKAYWMFVLVYMCVMAIIAAIETALDINAIGLVLMLSLLLPTLSIAARRLHDTGLSAWWLLIGLCSMLSVAFLPAPSNQILSVVGITALIVLLARKGQPGVNKYGASADEVSRYAPENLV